MRNFWVFFIKNQNVYYPIQETEKGKDTLGYLDSLFINLQRLFAKFKYTQQIDEQIHIIQITASEISKLQSNVRSEVTIRVKSV